MICCCCYFTLNLIAHVLILYESNPRKPIPPPPRATPGHLTRIKSRVGGNLTFVQVPVPQAFDSMKKTSQHLAYPNNMHQYHSRQQCKGFFSILFCNHVSSVKYRKQEQDTRHHEPAKSVL